jgi:GNAT superfamily N-acetyltransferase
MMRLKQVATRRDRAVFRDFVRRLYRGNACYKDTLASVQDLFLEHKVIFPEEGLVRAVQAVEGETVLAQCLLIHNPALPVLQMAFFEALPSRNDAVALLIQEARAEAGRRKAGSVIAGLNGHLAYGVGFLTDCHDLPSSFDSLYTPAYYPAYFAPYASAIKTLTAFVFDLSRDTFLEPVARHCREAGITFRNFDLKHLGREISLMADLSNRFLKDTYLYYPIDPQAMVQLVDPLKFFFRGGELIFACHQGKEVGFLFWHPDYNQVVPGGRRNSLPGIGLRYWLKRRSITNFKINAIGVDPAFRKKGVAAGLIQRMLAAAGPGYRTAETNFIWDSNRLSSGLCRRFAFEEWRHYRVFEIPLEAANADL